KSALLVLRRGAHLLLLAARAGAFQHPAANVAVRGMRHAESDGPVDLVQLAGPEQLAELVGGADGFREDEHAGGVAVEAVDETRLFGGVGNEGAGERIDVARRTRATLHGEAGGLVEGDDALVL